MNLVDYGKNVTEVRAADTSFEPMMLGARLRLRLCHEHGRAYV